MLGNGFPTCAYGLNCFKMNDFWSQCLKSCPSGWFCDFNFSPTISTSTNPSTTSISTTTIASTTTSISISTSHKNTSGDFQNCRFRFGAAFQGPNYDYSSVDYISTWVGKTTPGFGYWNPYWHKPLLEAAVKFNKTPVFYGYVIAFMGNDQWGLQDCDVGQPNLCQRGADFIRTKREEILSTYKLYAKQAAKIVGSEGEFIWLIEPDFWQYYVTNNGPFVQQNCGLSGKYMRELYDEISRTVKSELPNTKISFDISALVFFQ